MIKEAIIFFGIEFLLFAVVAFIIRGFSKVKRFWEYFDEFLGFIFIIGALVFLWKFSTFAFLDELFLFLWGMVLLAIALVVFIAVIGIEFGNLLEKIIIGRR